MFIVYIWLENKKSVGHVAAHIVDQKSRRQAYISWWPAKGAGPSLRGVKSKSVSNLFEDKKGMGRWPDVAHKLEGLDDVKGIEWWNVFSLKPSSKYGLVTTNCAWTVQAALNAAGGGNYVSLADSAIEQVVNGLKSLGAPANLVVGGLAENTSLQVRGADGMVPTLLTPSEMHAYTKAVESGLKAKHRHR